MAEELARVSVPQLATKTCATWLGQQMGTRILVSCNNTAGARTARRVAVEAKHDKFNRLLRKAAGQVPVAAALRSTALRCLRVKILHLEVGGERVDRLLWRGARCRLWNTVFNVAKLPLDVVRILKARCV